MNAIGDILHRQMSRGDFIRSLLMIVLAVIGFSNIIALLSEQKDVNKGDDIAVKRHSTHGFGSNKFGT